MSDSCVLVVAEQGPLREGLRALLGSIRGLWILETESYTSAVAISATCRPRLAVLEYFSVADAGRALAKIKGDSPDTRCVALVDSVQEQNAALSAGADIAPLKGVRAEQLFTEIEGLLVHR
jgi:DNA-binding NarL/FixJ family response regulator